MAKASAVRAPLSLHVDVVEDDLPETDAERNAYDLLQADAIRHPVRARVALDARCGGGRRTTVTVFERAADGVTETQSLEVDETDRFGHLLGRTRIYTSADIARWITWLRGYGDVSAVGAVPVIAPADWPSA
jgi:hypothetical protein